MKVIPIERLPMVTIAGVVRAIFLRNFRPDAQTYLSSRRWIFLLLKLECLSRQVIFFFFFCTRGYTPEEINTHSFLPEVLLKPER